MCRPSKRSGGVDPDPHASYFTLASHSHLSLLHCAHISHIAQRAHTWDVKPRARHSGIAPPRPPPSRARLSCFWIDTPSLRVLFARAAHSRISRYDAQPSISQVARVGERRLATRRAAVPSSDCSLTSDPQWQCNRLGCSFQSLRCRRHHRCT